MPARRLLDQAGSALSTSQERVTGLIIEEDRLLLVAGWSGWLTTPGGRRNRGESLEECLAREIGEELSVGVPSFEHFLTFMQYRYDEARLQPVHAYLVAADGTPLPSGEIEAIRWVAYKDRRDPALRIARPVKDVILPALYRDFYL